MNKSETKVVRGTGIGEGCTVGVLRFLQTSLQKSDERGRGAHEERIRLYEAITEVKQSLSHLQKTAEEEIGAEAAEIFAIHVMLLEDEDLLERIECADCTSKYKRLRRIF